MTRTKDPAAQKAPARRAVVEIESRVTPEQIVLPLIPRFEGTADPPTSGRDGTGVSAVKMLDRGSGNATSSRKENPVRRQRQKSPVSMVDIKRFVKAASGAGLSIRSLEVRPDGSIVLGTIGPADDEGEDVFARWADRL